MQNKNRRNKIGNSLIKFNLKDLKKALSVHGFEGDTEKFLGDYWNDFLDNSFGIPTKFHAPKDDSAKTIIEYIEYQMWTYKTKTLIQLLPFAKKFLEAVHEESVRQQMVIMHAENQNGNSDGQEK